MASYQTNCIQCGKMYEAKRKTSKFCGDKCRQLHHRKHPNDFNVAVELTKALDALRHLELLPADDLMKHAWLLEKVRNSQQYLDKRLNDHVDSIFGKASE